MQLSGPQLQEIAQDIFFSKLSAAFARTLPEFGALSQPAQAEFLEICIDDANAHGLQTEQGIAAYALIAWFLNPGFEALSKNLPLLFASRFPEVRKVHAMNEWAHALMKNRLDEAAADEELRLAFHRTAAWGAQRQL